MLVSRCLGLEIDYQLNWNYHVPEVIKAFTQKLNLFKSLYFRPKKGRENFLLQGYTSIRNLRANDLELVWQDPHG